MGLPINISFVITWIWDCGKNAGKRTGMRFRIKKVRRGHNKGKFRIQYQKIILLGNNAYMPAIPLMWRRKKDIRIFETAENAFDFISDALFFGAKIDEYK